MINMKKIENSVMFSSIITFVSKKPLL